MRDIIFLIIFSLIFCSGYTQTIPNASLYLGQIPPDSIPKMFNLSVADGFHAIERIAISNDGKSIFYQETNGYDATSIDRIKYYTFDKNKWNGPYVLKDVFTGIALSFSGDTIYSGQGFVIKENTGWTKPIKFGTKIKKQHYFQVTNSGAFYASIDNVQGNIGKKDWSKIIINKLDTIVTSLGSPINTVQDDLDFYIAKDESYIIFASDRDDIVKYGAFDLFISFKKNDNTWTVPQNLGKIINDPLEVRWGPFVSADNKYLFYSRTSKRDNSDACTYWVRIDNVLDSLKKINYQIEDKYK